MKKDTMTPPLNLDDIVRAHRDMYQIGIANQLELQARLVDWSRDIPVTERLYEACFVAFRYRFQGAEDGSLDTIHLVGTKESDGNPRITNVITGIYQNSIYTLSGSHYKTESLIQRDIPPEYLAVVCKSLHGTRLAKMIEAPYWMSLLHVAGSVFH